MTIPRRRSLPPRLHLQRNRSTATSSGPFASPSRPQLPQHPIHPHRGRRVRAREAAPRTSMFEFVPKSLAVQRVLAPELPAHLLRGGRVRPCDAVPSNSIFILLVRWRTRWLAVWTTIWLVWWRTRELKMAIYNKSIESFSTPQLNVISGG